MLETEKKIKYNLERTKDGKFKLVFDDLPHDLTHQILVCVLAHQLEEIRDAK